MLSSLPRHLLSFLALILLHVSLHAQAIFVLPPPTGPFPSFSLSTSVLTDPSRPHDPYNASHPRRIMISRFTPTPPHLCTSTQLVRYMPDVVAEAEDQILGEYGYPLGIWSQFYLEVCAPQPEPGPLRLRPRPRTAFPDTHAHPQYDGNSWPVVLFSPGLNTTRLFTQSFCLQLASFGYEVITIDHPYDVDVVAFPDGQVIYGGVVIPPREEGDSEESVVMALDVRGDDVRFLVDWLEGQAEAEDGGWGEVGYGGGGGKGQGKRERRYLMAGDSFGGAAAATAMLKDPRIAAGVNIDGMMFGPPLTTPIGPDVNGMPRKFVLWGSDGHNSSADSDPSWAKFWEQLGIAQEHGAVDWRREFTVPGSSHGSYWDLNFLVDVAGIRDELGEDAKLLIGEPHGPRMWEIFGRYLDAFFRFALGGEESEILGQETEEFPEVVILKE